MDSATTSTGASSRTDSATRPAQRSAANGKQQTNAPTAKTVDPSITVKGRFDPDLRRFFVTILDTSSQTLITQFPSQAVARYVQQLKKAAGNNEPPPQDADSLAASNAAKSSNAASERRLNQTT